MAEINKATLTEADIISKYLLPAIKAAGWDDLTQIRQEVKLQDGKVIVRGPVAMRKTVKSADIVLYHKMGFEVIGHIRHATPPSLSSSPVASEP